MIEAQLQENLQNALIKQYYSNLEFLKEQDLNLYNKINTFSTMIDEGYYKERFALEFVKENGQFDILDIENNSYLYGRSANVINEHFVNNCNFNKNSVFNSLTAELYLPRKKDIEIRAYGSLYFYRLCFNILLFFHFSDNDHSYSSILHSHCSCFNLLGQKRDLDCFYFRFHASFKSCEN